jgi:hypothetical protein
MGNKSPGDRNWPSGRTPDAGVPQLMHCLADFPAEPRSTGCCPAVLCCPAVGASGGAHPPW